MLKIFFICFATLHGTSLATACANIEKSGLQHLIVNYCQYPIILGAAEGLSGNVPSLGYR
jgi:hypothetical protein